MTTIFIGLAEIGRALGGRSRHTAARYIKERGLPACKLASGEFILTATLLDSWILARHLAELREARNAATVKNRDRASKPAVSEHQSAD